MFNITTQHYMLTTEEESKGMTKRGLLNTCRWTQYELRMACDYIKELEAKIATLEANNG